MINDQEKYDLLMTKAAGKISKLVFDQHQPIFEGKSLQVACNTLQEHFQNINPMNTTRIIYKATDKKLSNFKNLHKYTSQDPVAFDKVVALLTDISLYTLQSTKMYFQATMSINIRTDYSSLLSAIQKDWKDKTTNLAELVRQIIKHFEFMEGSKKTQKIIQTSTRSIHRKFKSSKASKIASQVCLQPNLPLWLPKKSSRRLYNTRNCSQD